MQHPEALDAGSGPVDPECRFVAAEVDGKGFQATEMVTL